MSLKRVSKFQRVSLDTESKIQQHFMEDKMVLSEKVLRVIKRGIEEITRQMRITDSLAMLMITLF